MVLISLLLASASSQDDGTQSIKQYLAKKRRAVSSQKRREHSIRTGSHLVRQLTSASFEFHTRITVGVFC